MNLFSKVRQDLPASIVVVFVAVPLCLGIALASGAPLFSGLIAGIIGGLVVGSLSRSQLGVSGPAAGLAVIVLAAINNLGFEAFLLSVVIAGAMQLVLGYLRAGVVAYYFPSAVIKGMLAGIGIIIILKQIPHAFGHDSDPEGEMSFSQPDGETTFSSLFSIVRDLEAAAIVVSMTALAILIVWDTWLSKKGRIFRLVQGPLVAVAFGIIYQVVTSKFLPAWSLESSHLVSVPIAQGLSEMKDLLVFPDWSSWKNPAVWVTAATIAVVASLETLLCVEATDKLDPHKRVTPVNPELKAQGAGNILSGLIGGLPVTQVIVRSSANIQSGGQTKLSAMLHGLFLCVFVFALPKILNLIPLAVLAAILLVVGYKLARPAVFKAVFKQGASQWGPFLATIIGIVFTDLLVGIGLGFAFAIVVILKRSTQNSHFLHMKERETVVGQRDVKIQLAEEVTFLNRGAILKTLSTIPNNSKVTIDMSESVVIDHDVQEVIEDFKASAKRREIDVTTIEYDKATGSVRSDHRSTDPELTSQS